MQTPEPAAATEDLCAHGCGLDAMVQHADGRMLCYPCYRIETGGDNEPMPGCPTCSPVPAVAWSDVLDEQDIEIMALDRDPATDAAIPLHCCVSYANGRGYHDAACPRKPDAASVPESNLAYVIRRLREVAKETPEEYARRWPYHHKVEVNAADARDLLDHIDTLEAERHG